MDMALASKDDEDGFTLRGVLIEVLSKAGDWGAATQVAQHSVSVLPDTRRNAVRRLVFLLVLEAVRLERAIAEGRITDISVHSTEWLRLERQLAEARQ